MTIERPTFHESWHRVAELRPKLRASTRTTRQVYRGGVWHVFEDPTGGQFFRLNDPAYRFVGLLDGRRTVAQAWALCNELLGDDAPTQGEAIQLLGQLFSSNLIAGEAPADADTLFRRQKKRIGREVRSYLMSFLFLRIPLWDPDAFLSRWRPLVAWLFTPLGAILWFVVVAAGGYHLLDKGPRLADQFSGILASENLIWLYASFAFIKLFHELGHGFACKVFGARQDDGSGAPGAVHSMGVMFLVFLPVPYVDATSSWGLKRKHHRIIVGAAGMIVEVFIAALAAILWARSAEGTLWSALAYNAMFLAGVSTVLFNGNPLMRYDGYYILTDLLETPNLAKRSQDFVQHMVKKFAWGVRRSLSPAQTPGERVLLPVYWAASLVYRVLVYVAITLFILDQQFVLGAALLLFIAAVWLLLPLGKFVRYLFADPELARTRRRAIWTTFAACLALVLLLGVIPAPAHLRVEGVVEPARFANLYAPTDGRIEHVLPTGSLVSPQSPELLVEAASEELEAQRRGLAAEESKLRTERRIALDEEPAEVRRLDESLAAVLDQRRWVDESLAGLRLAAPIEGVWIAPELEERIGTSVRRGEPLGVVADLGTLIVRGSAEQVAAARLIEEADRRVEVRPRGRPSQLLVGTVERIFPAASDVLPSPALGFIAGGGIALDPSEPSGRRAASPLFEVRIALDGAHGLLPGQRVVARFTLPSRPLALQAWHAARQVLQERLRI